MFRNIIACLVLLWLSGVHVPARRAFKGGYKVLEERELVK